MQVSLLFGTDTEYSSPDEFVQCLEDIKQLMRVISKRVPYIKDGGHNALTVAKDRQVALLMEKRFAEIQPSYLQLMDTLEKLYEMAGHLENDAWTICYDDEHYMSDLEVPAEVYEATEERFTTLCNKIEEIGNCCDELIGLFCIKPIVRRNRLDRLAFCFPDPAPADRDTEPARKDTMKTLQKLCDEQVALSKEIFASIARSVDEMFAAQETGVAG